MRFFSSQNFSFQDLGYAFDICALFIGYVKPRGLYIFLSLEVESTFLILSYFEAKYQKCLLCDPISRRDVVFY